MREEAENGEGESPLLLRADECLWPSREKCGVKWKGREIEGVLIMAETPSPSLLSLPEIEKPTSVTGVGVGKRGDTSVCPGKQVNPGGVRMMDGEAPWGVNYLIGLMF